MKTTERILLFEDKRRITKQEYFNIEVSERLTEIVKLFGEIGDIELSTEDLKAIQSEDPKSIVIKKLAPTLGEANIGGMKVRPSKAIELLEINYDDFVTAVQDFRKWITTSIQNTRMMESVSIIFDPKFFVIENGEVELDNTYFEKWSETLCKIFTKNETQARIFSELNTICEAMNRLMEIKRSEDVDMSTFNSRMTTERIKLDPNRLINEELIELISVEGGKFKVNYKFIVRH